MAQTEKEKVYKLDVSQVFTDWDGETAIWANTDAQGKPVPDAKGVTEKFQLKHVLARIANSSPMFDPPLSELDKQSLFHIARRANRTEKDGNSSIMILAHDFKVLEKVVDCNKVKQPGQGQEKTDFLMPIIQWQLVAIIEEAKENPVGKQEPKGNRLTDLGKDMVEANG